jgi:hypothetical protein
MFCKNCGTPLGDDDKFCSACGTSVVSPDSTGARAPASRRRTNRPEHRDETQHHSGSPFIPDSAVLAQFNDFIAKKDKLKRKIAWPIAAVCAAYAIFCLCIGEIGGALLGAALTLVAFFSAFTRSYLSITQYKVLRGSSTNSGKPRCIHCGRVGLYTHGKYRSNTKFHDCSKCGVTLYTS